MQRSKNRRALAVAGMCLAVTGIPTTAFAQTQAGGQPTDEDEIIVTGSRIASPNTTGSTPVQQVTAEQLEQRGTVNLADAIRTLPAAGSTALAPAAAPRDSINSGLFAVDLRTLGLTRTLVLVNGRRHVAGLPGTPIVDLNTLPVDLIQRIEVTTGGASAVYGSDAVAGVVNVILKEDFEGLQLRSQYGISSRGDGRQFKVSLLGGINIGDRGNATLFASYDKTGHIDFKDREISRDAVFLPNSRQPDVVLRGRDAFNSILSIALNTPQGVFVPTANAVGAVPVTSRRTVLPNGTVTTPDAARDGLDPNAYIFLSNPNERFLIGGNFRFGFTDNISLFLDTTYSRAEVLQQFEPTFVRTGVLNIGGSSSTAIPLTIPSNNPFIPAAIRSLIPAGRAAFGFGRHFPELGPRQTDHVRNLFRIIGGFEGELPLFGSNWQWEAYYQYGRTEQHQLFRNGVNTLNLFQALRVEPDGAGGFRCVDVAARAQGCIPVNLFTGQPLTQAERNFIGASATIDAYNTQQVAAASISGSVVELPAGPLGLALGVEWRKEESHYRPSELLEKGLTTLQFVGRTDGEFDVKEAFIEARVPLLSDLPAIDYLEVEGAFRYADYSTSGGVEAWKLGANYRPIRDLRLRTVLSRAVRAPSISELFQGAVVSLGSVADPCARGGATPARRTNCLTFPGVTPNFNPPALTPVLLTIAGNPNLEAETARTWTVGGVFTPSFIRGLTLSVDYFRIVIENGINGLGAQLTAEQCADSGSPDLCSLIRRDPQTGFITDFLSLPINVAREKMRGLDVELGYNTSLGSLGGRLAATLNYSRLFEYSITAPGVPASPGVGFPFRPKNRGNFRLSYDNDGFNVATNIRYIGKAFRIVGEEFEGNAVSPQIYTDVQLRYTFDKRHSLYIGANNVFDNDPPLFPAPYVGAANGHGTAANTYDTIGRFFYAGVSTKF